MLKRTLWILVIVVAGFAGCKSKLNKEALYGDWKYVKIDHPYGGDPTDTTSAFELNEQKPSITFKPQNQLIINWGGKILSQGTFEVKGKEISYTEKLPGGKTRNFPFFVSEINEKRIVFETLGAEGSRVTAVKR